MGSRLETALKNLPKIRAEFKIDQKMDDLKKAEGERDRKGLSFIRISFPPLNRKGKK